MHDIYIHQFEKSSNLLNIDINLFSHVQSLRPPHDSLIKELHKF